jgi:hypothetical protein
LSRNPRITNQHKFSKPISDVLKREYHAEDYSKIP